MTDARKWLARSGLLCLIGLVLLIDGAALHDILIGEPTLWQEWTFLAISLGILLLAFRALVGKTVRF